MIWLIYFFLNFLYYKMYLISIPSYNRYNIINTHTLAMLEKHKINSKIIYIFVANKTEKKKYLETLDKKFHKNLIIGKKGLKNQKNFINKYFEENQDILFIDDDVKDIYQLENYNKKNRTSNTKKPLENLHKFILDSFKHIKEHKSFLWGIYPINNPYFMFDRTTHDLRFIVGPFYGIINRHNKDLVLTIDEKEDVERTLKHFVLDNIVIRFNNICINTVYYKTKGGMNSKDRKLDALKSAKYLNKKYPELTKLKLDKKSGYAEVKLIY
jgi:hypothetical protein